MIVRDGGRTLAGDTLGERGLEADHAAGEQLVGRGGVIRLFSFEGERSAQSSRTRKSRTSTFSM